MKENFLESHKSQNKENTEKIDVKSNLRVFANFGSRISNDAERNKELENKIIAYIEKLSEPNATKHEVQNAVRSITLELLENNFKKEDREDILLVPVLRSGITMWEPANDFFKSPETSFMVGQKEKGISGASITWTKRSNLNNKKIIILDPIIATGDTLKQVCREIEESSEHPFSITILSCYAAPEGVGALLKSNSNISVVVGCMAESIDDAGYLVPSTHGDMGNKLFGTVTEMEVGKTKTFNNVPEEITIEVARKFVKSPFSEPKPDFISADRIEKQIERVQEEVKPYLFSGIELFIKSEGLNEHNLETETIRQSWLWAVKSGKYRAIYNVSREEAEMGIEFITKNAVTIDAIGKILDEKNGVTKIVNYALHKYAQEFDQIPGRQIRTAKKSMPVFGIQSCDEYTIAIRKDGFINDDPKKSFDNPEQIYDWHDLAHIVGASSSEGAFGTKYHDGLDELDRYYRSLTEGEGMNDASGPMFSDGMLFTQLSKSLYEFSESQKNLDGTDMYNIEQIHKFITEGLFAYLGGSHDLFHPGTGKNVRGGRMITSLELAVLEQNKRYERRAAEMEQKMFVRGTPDGPRGNPAKDPLVSLTRSKRIEYLAGLGDKLLYFEARNIIRHRAHEDALGQFSNYLLALKTQKLKNDTMGDEGETLFENIEDAHLLNAVTSFYQMQDLKTGREINLYKIVRDILKARKIRKK